MIALVGYTAFGLNVVGNLLLAHCNTLGWTVRMITNIAWIVYAVQLSGGEPIALNHIAFFGINSYGLWKWRKLGGIHQKIEIENQDLRTQVAELEGGKMWSWAQIAKQRDQYARDAEKLEAENVRLYEVLIEAWMRLPPAIADARKDNAEET